MIKFYFFVMLRNYLWYNLDMKDNKFEKFAEYLSQKRDEGVLDVLTNKQAFIIGSSDMV